MLWHEFSFAARTLFRQPGFTLIAVLGLALRRRLRRLAAQEAADDPRGQARARQIA